MALRGSRTKGRLAGKAQMNTWSVQHAKARFSKLLDTCLDKVLKLLPNAAWRPQFLCQSKIGADCTNTRARP